MGDSSVSRLPSTAGAAGLSTLTSTPLGVVVNLDVDRRGILVPVRLDNIGHRRVRLIRLRRLQRRILSRLLLGVLVVFAHVTLLFEYEFFTGPIPTS
jgi:hypothetical protein